MKLFLSITALFFTPLALAADLPDLLFLSPTHFGGHGRLTFQSGRYHLVDGRINSYVVDGSSIRQMRPDEGGGNMANPTQMAVLSGKLFVNSSFNRVSELDPATGKILNSYGKFEYRGSGGAPAMFGSDKALLLLEGTKLTALSPGLKKISEKEIPQQTRHVRLSPDFIQDGTKLYGLEIDNPNTYTECAGGCNLDTVIRQTTIDFTNPLDLKIETKQEKIEKQVLISNKIIDGQNQGWFLVLFAHKANQSILEWRPFAKLATPALRLPLPEGERILAVTKTAPLWMVLSGKEGNRLVQVNKDKKLSSFPLPWVKGSIPSFSLSQADGKLYIAAGHQLAIYEGGKLLHQQDFVSAVGSGEFQMEQLLPVSLPKTEQKVDRARMEALAKKDYWGDTDRLGFSAEVEKLTPADTWAIDLLIALLQNRAISFHGGPVLAAKGLEKFGAAAERAVPALIYSTMEGSAIRGDTMEIAKRVVPQLDPSGKARAAIKADCIKKSYVCEHVLKNIQP